MKERTKNTLAILWLVWMLVTFVMGIGFVGQLYGAEQVDLGFFTLQGCCGDDACFRHNLWVLFFSPSGVFLLLTLFMYGSFTRTAILQLINKT